MWNETMIRMLLNGLCDTFYMTLVSTFFGYVIGLPLGIALTLTDSGGIMPNKGVYRILDVFINITRSIPFLILLILVMPLTKMIAGKTYGSTATIVPLTLAAAPLIGRMVESSLKEVGHGVIEAARAMGASKLTIIRTVLIPEALAPLILAYAFLFIGVLDMSAMAGYIGGGGLGNFAIAYGYQKFDQTVTWTAVIIMIVLVQVVQAIANAIAKRLLRR